jgi:hypothetical protein
MRRCVVVGVLLAALPHRAIADNTDAARSTRRLSVGIAAAEFANYPGSFSDLGVAASLGKPLWLGRRYRHAQLDLSGTINLGWGAEANHAYIAAAPQVGVNLFLGSFFGLEFHVGPALLAQLGERSVVGCGLLANGGYVFRPWSDDRRRIVLALTMQVGAYFASDPENDLAMNASAVTFGLTYETPL